MSSSRAAKPLPDFHTAPGHLFRRARQFHDALWLAKIGDSPTPLQYAVLTAVELEPGIDQRTLGERIDLDKSTVGEMVTRLSRRGLIDRDTDEADRRRRVLTVTPEGRDVLYGAAQFVSEIGEEMLSALTPAERGKLLSLLDKVAYSPAALKAAR